MTDYLNVTGYLFFMSNFNQINAKIHTKSSKSELALFDLAIQHAKTEILLTKNSIDASMVALWDILHFYELALQDPYMVHAIQDYIMNTHLTAEAAISHYFDSFVESLKTKDAYFKARSSDFIDLKHRLLNALKAPNRKVAKHTLSFDRPTILVFDSIFPYELSQIHYHQVVAVISKDGSYHSHSAIILSSMKIPYMITPNINPQLKTGDIVSLNLTTGALSISDSIPTLQKSLSNSDNQEIIKLKPSIQLHPAINLINEIPNPIPSFWKSIGLYRTEFLFMEKNYLPDEIEQYLHYCSICQKANGIRVLFRLLDVEADKPLPLLEKGLYGIDLLLKNRNLLKSQLTALLCVSKKYPIGITVPMIQNQEQIYFILETIDSLKKQNDFDTVHFDYRFGIMVERMEALKGIKKLTGFDYILVGTNDLAAEYSKIDRSNHALNLESYLNQNLLNDIQILVEDATNRQLITMLCGDAANHREAIDVYRTIGITDFAPAAKSIHFYTE